jgi:hypothetical protein
MSTRIRRRLIIPALLALLCGVLLAGQAQATSPAVATGPAGQPAVEEEDQAIDEDGNGLTDCPGGPQEMSLARMSDLPTSLVENAGFAQLPGAVMNFAVPQNDTDQIMVTFSAEARLQGQSGSVVAPVDFLQIQILLNGVPMNPLNDLSFTTDAGQADATQACHRIGAGQHTLRVVWLLVDQGANNVLTGTLDDWTLHLEIND